MHIMLLSISTHVTHFKLFSTCFDSLQNFIVYLDQIFNNYWSLMGFLVYNISLSVFCAQKSSRADVKIA